MKEQIKLWLKAHNRDRYWLGLELGVDKKTVDNWLSSPKEIPVGKIKLIERLMEDDAAAEAQRRQQLEPTAQVFSVEVDLPTFRAYGKAALAQQKTIEDWAISELNEAADAYFADKERLAGGLTLSILSEDPITYGTERPSPSSPVALPGSPDSEAGRSMSDIMREKLQATQPARPPEA